jgi:hypothetical protein
MGRKALIAKELLEKAAARDYQSNAHQEKNMIEEISKYVWKTLKDRNWETPVSCCGPGWLRS